MLILSMLPSCSAITVATWARLPGSLTLSTMIRAGKRCGVGVVDIPAHVEPALRLVLEILQRRRLDRIDRDALARRDDADDAVARHRAAVRRELDRQIGIDAADRDRRRSLRAGSGRRFQLQLGRPGSSSAPNRADRALPCSRDTSRARRRRPSSRRARPPPSRRRSRPAPAAAARPSACRRRIRSWRARTARSTMRRPRPAY